MLPARSEKLTDGVMTNVLKGRIFSPSSTPAARCGHSPADDSTIQVLDIGGEMIEDIN